MAFSTRKGIGGDLGLRERLHSVLTERADSQTSWHGDNVLLFARESDTRQKFYIAILSFYFSQCRNRKFSKAVVNLRTILHIQNAVFDGVATQFCLANVASIHSGRA